MSSDLRRLIDNINGLNYVIQQYRTHCNKISNRNYIRNCLDDLESKVDSAVFIIHIACIGIVLNTMLFLKWYFAILWIAVYVAIWFILRSITTEYESNVKHAKSILSDDNCVINPYIRVISQQLISTKNEVMKECEQVFGGIIAEAHALKKELLTGFRNNSAQFEDAKARFALLVYSIPDVTADPDWISPIKQVQILINEHRKVMECIRGDMQILFRSCDELM